MSWKKAGNRRCSYQMPKYCDAIIIYILQKLNYCDFRFLSFGDKNIESSTSFWVTIRYCCLSKIWLLCYNPLPTSVALNSWMVGGLGGHLFRVAPPGCARLPVTTNEKTAKARTRFVILVLFLTLFQKTSFAFPSVSFNWTIRCSVPAFEQFRHRALSPVFRNFGDKKNELECDWELWN